MSVFDFALDKFKKMNTEEIEKGLSSSEGWGGGLHKNPDTMNAAHHELQRRYKELDEKKHGQILETSKNLSKATWGLFWSTVVLVVINFIFLLASILNKL